MTQPVLKAGTGVSGEGKHRIGLDSPIEWLLATTPGEKGVTLWMCIQYPITAMRIFRFFLSGHHFDTQLPRTRVHLHLQQSLAG